MDQSWKDFAIPQSFRFRQLAFSQINILSIRDVTMPKNKQDRDEVMHTFRDRPLDPKVWIFYIFSRSPVPILFLKTTKMKQIKSSMCLSKADSSLCLQSKLKIYKHFFTKVLKLKFFIKF